jgi:general secretion pathway protein D
MNSVPIGMILTLQPSINLQTQEITMNIRPTITKISDSANSVVDPAVAFIANQSKITIDSSVPIVQVKELDSILKIKSGQIMVIGGMMEDQSSSKNSGMPYAMDVPVFGNLFKKVTRTNKLVQTVIFIKATKVATDNVSKKDKDFYNNFAIDEEVHI